MSLYNIWHDSQHSKTTVIAKNMNEALDIFCNRHGYIDHSDYCEEKQISESDLNIEEVSHAR